MSVTVAAFLGFIALSTGVLAGWLAARRLFKTPEETKASMELLTEQLAAMTKDRDAHRHGLAELLQRIADERKAMQQALKGKTSAEVDSQLTDLGLRK